MILMSRVEHDARVLCADDGFDPDEPVKTPHTPRWTLYAERVTQKLWAEQERERAWQAHPLCAAQRFICDYPDGMAKNPEGEWVLLEDVLRILNEAKELK